MAKTVAPAHAACTCLVLLLGTATSCRAPVKTVEETVTVESEVEVATQAAPWDFGPLSHAAFLSHPEGGGANNAGVLLLSDTALSCAELRALDSTNLYDSSMLDAPVFLSAGQAVQLSFVYYLQDGDVPAGLEGFLGTWMSLSQDQSENIRDLRTAVLYEQEAYYIFQSDWVEITSVSASEVVGSYSNSWWSTSFTAEYCGTWDEPSWDSGR